MAEEQQPGEQPAEDDDPEARRERAASIRERIAGLRTGKPPEAEPEGRESPREFIARKMRERRRRRESGEG